MLNIRRIEWMYENFGVAAAVKSATCDLIAVFCIYGLLPDTALPIC